VLKPWGFSRILATEVQIYLHLDTVGWFRNTAKLMIKVVEGQVVEIPSFTTGFYVSFWWLELGFLNHKQ